MAEEARKRGFAGLLSRPAGGGSSSRSQPDTDADNPVAPVAQDQKGPLGLTTVSIPSPPTPPTVDIVFVHGLGGGSRKTWSFSPQPSHFWPGEWLPRDPDFQNARIHTFGYKVDWARMQGSIWSIQAFAQNLVGALRDHPDIRRGATRIILIGHSLGGCVCKKAYILARQDPTSQDWGRRVYSIFFLGTPHRGSNLAVALKNIMTVAWGKPFVADLTPNSNALSEMNEDFRHLAPDLRLCSFYETLPMKNVMVVEKESATLGYPGEQIIGMDADHRQICKFDTPSDPNYRILRNALVTSIDMAQAAPQGTEVVPSLDSQTLSPERPGRTSAEEISHLKSLLGVGPDVEGDLVTLQLLREPGSCEWFTGGHSFTQWESGNTSDILWVNGKPGAGKSVLSSHVINHVRRPEIACSYFFFKSGVAGKSSLSDCFRSLALQMAEQSDSVRQGLLRLEADDMGWGKTDHLSLWRKVFSGCILKLRILHQHIWVIDGLDECDNFDALFKGRVFSSLPPGLRVFIASRNLEKIERGLVPLGQRVVVHTLTDDDTVEDIRRFLETQLKEIGRLDDDEACDAMCEKILAKSSGSFLWVKLVLQEFESCWTKEAMEAALEEVPVGLQEMYCRILQRIESHAGNTQLAKVILSWVLLACRPLTVDEIRAAVRLDVNKTLQQGAKAIPNLCGQLVYVDRSDRVQVIHETARQFLTSGELRQDWVVPTASGHSHLASIILEYLVGPALKLPQDRPTQTAFKTKAFRKPPAMVTTPPDLALLDYGSSHLADHLLQTTGQDGDLADKLCAFLQSRNILSWIEHLAKNDKIGVLCKTAMSMRDYLGHRMKHVPRTDTTTHLIDSWVTDLIRVPAKFGPQLRLCPSAIYHLVPPLCPPETIIAKSFSRDAKLRPLSVKGISPGTWDDCLAQFEFPGGYPLSVAHGSRFFAIGCYAGEISLFECTSAQKLRVLVHPEVPGRLEFGPGDQQLACSGRARMVVWDTRTGDLANSIDLSSPILTFAFLSHEELLLVTSSFEISKWDLETGEIASMSWLGRTVDSGIVQKVPQHPPTHATLLVTKDRVLLGLRYSCPSMLLIWDALESDVLGRWDIGDDVIQGLAFNQNPAVPVLVVSCAPGTLYLLNYTSLKLESSRRGPPASKIACSPNGRSLLTAGHDGRIRVFDFDQDEDGNISLTLIYSSDHLCGLALGAAFSFDGLRFLDIHGSLCRLWAPAALVRNDNELGSTSNAPPLPPKISVSSHVVQGEGNFDRIATPFAAFSDAFVVAGKHSGKVVLLSLHDASEVSVICKHHKEVLALALCRGESAPVLASADISGDVLVTDMSGVDYRHGPGSLPPRVPDQQKQQQRGSTAKVVLRQNFGGAVRRFLANTTADRLYVGGHQFDELWELPSGRVISRRPTPSDPNRRHTSLHALQHPTHTAWFILVVGDVAHVLAWDDFSELSSIGDRQGIRITGDNITTESEVVRNWLVQSGRFWETRAAPWGYPIVWRHAGPAGVVMEHWRSSRSGTLNISMWPAAALDPSRNEPFVALDEPILSALAPMILKILGFVGNSTMVFLDINLWVYSVELPALAAMERAAAAPPATPAEAGQAMRTMATLCSRRIPSATTLQPPLSTAPPSHQALRSSESEGGGLSDVVARRHFFALGEWRADDEVQCAMVPSAAQPEQSPDFVFASGGGIVVVKGGLEFGEVVVLNRQPPPSWTGRLRREDSAGAGEGADGEGWRPD